MYVVDVVLSVTVTLRSVSLFVSFVCVILDYLQFPVAKFVDVCVCEFLGVPVALSSSVVVIDVSLVVGKCTGVTVSLVVVKAV